MEWKHRSASKKAGTRKGLVLSISRYKEIEYEEVRYEKPEVIIEKIEELEGKILENIDELKWLLNEET